MQFKKSLVKFLQLFNFPAHIKRFYLKRKIARHKNPDKNNHGSFFNKLINFFMICILTIGIIYLNVIYWNWYLLGGTALLSLFIIIKKMNKDKDKQDLEQQISQLILKDDIGKSIKKWQINDATSLLIGKATTNDKVDIDLSEVVYSSLVSRQHAVMNNTGNNWYFEDVGSANGSGIKRRKSQEKFKVKTGKPYKLNSGDLIYVANTKLLIK